MCATGKWYQKIFYDINIQRQEIDKEIIIENTIKINLKSQQSTNASWLVTTIKSILKTPIQKFENTIFLFRRTHEASVRNRKTIAAFKGDLGAEITAQKDISVN